MFLSMSYASVFSCDDYAWQSGTALQPRSEVKVLYVNLCTRTAKLHSIPPCSSVLWYLPCLLSIMLLYLINIALM